MWKRWTRHWGLHRPPHAREARETRVAEDSDACEEITALGVGNERQKKPKKDEKDKSKKTKRMTKKPSTTKTRTGNALAQFVILCGLTVVAYQFLVTRLYSSDGVTAEHEFDMGKLDKHRAKYRNDREVISTTEFSCFMACVGLFGLMQRKKKRSEEEEAVLEAQRRSVEKRVAKARDLTLTKRSSLWSSKEDTTGPLGSPRTTATSTKTQKDLVALLSSDVQLELLTFLSAEELVSCTMVNKSWLEAVGDQSEILWQQVFQRDFGESGHRFAGIVPHICWRQYYFLHHLSRAVEIAQWLDATQQRKCVVIEGHVYDVTSFLDSHPGGYHVIGDVLGTDASDLWDQFQHSAEAKELMKEFIVEDAVLNALVASDSKFLKRNLAVVDARWKKITWWLAHAHLFGGFSRRFLDMGFKFVVWRTTKRPLRPIRQASQ